jgi:transposase InsO family protein
VDIRFVLVCDLEGKLHMETFFCTDLQTSPVQILQWVIRRWSVEVPRERTLHRQYATRREAKADVIEYIEMFYNSTRKHLYLGYVSPNDDEAFFT